MTGRRSQVTAILRHSFLVAAVAACLVGRSEADTYIIPALHITQIYDDNIFFEGSDEVSDRITRVSPGLQLGYVSRQLSLSGEVNRRLRTGLPIGTLGGGRYMTG